MATFRRARESDVERLAEIHMAAFPDPRGIDVRQRNLLHNPFGGFEHLVVVEDAGALVGHAFLFPFEASFGGVKVKVGGIASVGVAPEARGRGLATQLVRHLHVLSDRRGDAVTMLHAFRHGFYERLGYATTSSRKRLAIDTRSVPESWRALARGCVRGVRSGDDRTLRRLHERAAERATGWITRPKRFWEMLLARERRMTLVCDEARGRSRGGALARGYVAFTISQAQLHAETRIEVDELVAEDDEARRALLGALAAMRDQAAEIVLEIAETDPLERALVDPDGRRSGTEAVEHALGEIVGGPMVRIEDVPRALAARGYAGSGAFDVVVRAEGGDEADGIAVGVRVRDGRAEVGPARGPRARGALQTTRAGLAAIFYGALSATDAVALGLADADPRVASRVDAIARLPALAPVDTF
ncbi:MAG: GNAT family N-acetyltransferase [Labilithrix sp.]|nr:GNAT family N-acetyltransferase [Labilithrix sp.]